MNSEKLKALHELEGILERALGISLITFEKSQDEDVNTGFSERTYDILKDLQSYIDQMD